MTDPLPTTVTASHARCRTQLKVQASSQQMCTPARAKHPEHITPPVRQCTRRINVATDGQETAGPTESPTRAGGQLLLELPAPNYTGKGNRQPASLYCNSFYPTLLYEWNQQKGHPCMHFGLARAWWPRFAVPAFVPGGEPGSRPSPGSLGPGTASCGTGDPIGAGASAAAILARHYRYHYRLCAS